MSLIINGGTKITGGFTLNSQPLITPGASFTISDIGDFTTAGYAGANIVDFGGTIGLLSTPGAYANLAWYGIQISNFTSPKLSEIEAYFMTNMLVNNGTIGYNFTVAGTGGASNITKIVLGLSGSNFIISPVNPLDSNFTTDSAPGIFPSIIFLAMEDISPMMEIAETLAVHVKELAARNAGQTLKLETYIDKLEREIVEMKEKS